MTRREYDWRCGKRVLRLGRRTAVMGILNVTPDSFSDGGRYLDPRRALDRAAAMIAAGADVIDVGGESTRPGSERVPAEEEWRRVEPVLRALAGSAEALISIDSMKAEVADRALHLGADIVNDVSAMTWDPAMPEVVRSRRAGVVLMHMQGEPGTMQDRPSYGDVVEDIRACLRGRLEAAEAAGIERSRCCIDPGVGFGKTLEHNLECLRGLPRLAELDAPLMVGLSRKRFLGELSGREPSARTAAGLGAGAYAILRGAHILRVHDVQDSCDMARIVDRMAIQEAKHGLDRNYQSDEPPIGA